MTDQNIWQALAAFQAEMPTVGKDSTNPHFRSKYADIATITKIVMPILNKHGLVYSCQPERSDGQWMVTAELRHAATEGVIRGSLPMVGAKMQDFGSSLTYARRYLLGCLTGVVTDDDDDGNHANTQPSARSRVPSRDWITEARSASDVDTVRDLWQQARADHAPDYVLAEITSIGTGLEAAAQPE